MKVTGSAILAAPLSQVWDALHDPAVLVRTIPGCSRMEVVGVDVFGVTISAGVASIKGTYAGQVALSDPEPPNSFVLRARGQGAPGTVDATVAVRLAEEPGGTRVDYDADAVVGGMIGGVGQRMLTTVARRTAGEFFANVERDLTRSAPAPVMPASKGSNGSSAPVATAPAASVPVGAVLEAPRAAGRPESVAWAMTAAFSAGGAFTLAGIAVGYLIGRRSRR